MSSRIDDVTNVIYNSVDKLRLITCEVSVRKRGICRVVSSGDCIMTQVMSS